MILALPRQVKHFVAGHNPPGREEFKEYGQGF
jgi:hypothetical protein